MCKIQFLLLALFFTLIFFPLTGCSRHRYRQQADCEVNELLSAVSRDKRWELLDYGLQPNQNSRFYDPYDPDCEPMPPDDSTAHRYMHCVDGKRNGDWDAKGRTNYVENPYWQQYLPLNENGYVALDKETAFQLAQIHSPEYQTALENLYMSALAVSYQRFQFDTQFLGGSSMFYSSNGAVRDSTWTNSNWVGFNKKLATGGEAVVNLANSITWQVAGPDTQSYNTILSANFLQPFLRDGGREYVLESLTRSERNLLANVRQMAFYRQGFYKTVVFGGNNVGMPVTNGSPGSSSSGSNLTGGYVSLLASQVRINNIQNNVISMRESEKQFISLFEAGRVDGYIQVEQARANYLESQSQLMSQVNSYNSSVEQFVVSRLGLPPDLKVQIDDPLLKQFEIMSPELTALQEDLETHYLVIRDHKQHIPDSLIDALSLICSRLNGEIANVYTDIEKLEAKMPERISNIRFLEQQTEQFEGYVDPASFSEETFVERVTHLRKEVPGLEANLRMTTRLIENVRKINRDELVKMLGLGRIDPDSMECLIALRMQGTLTATKLPDEAGRKLNDEQTDPYRFFMSQVMRKLTGDVRQLSLEQARARLDAISMTPIDITPETAIKVASQYRLDWMNSRADLVNTWRDIEIAANQLQSYLNFSVNGELGTRTNNPVAFDSRNGRINVGVEWDAPLTRLIERNAYREAQINYQRARRNYYNFVDGVNKTLRDSLRNIDNVQFDFEVRRRAVLVAISRVHLAQLAMEKPPAVGQTSESMSNNLARDLVEALNSLLDAQNQFMAIWVDHYGMRSALCLDLGIMQLDENGIWIDPGSVRETDYSQLVSGQDEESSDLSLPPAPLLPGGMSPQRAPDISNVDDLIFPQELRQAPPAPNPLAPPEPRPSNIPPWGPLPQGSARPGVLHTPTQISPQTSQQTLPQGMSRGMPARMTPTQTIPSVSEASELPGDLSPLPSQTLREMSAEPAPKVTRSALFPENGDDMIAPSAPNATPAMPADLEDQQPAVPQRRPSSAVLQNLGAESPQRFPEVDEEASDTSWSTDRLIVQNTNPVAYHSVKTAAGRSQYDEAVPVSVSMARSNSLPVPNSPGDSMPSSNASRQTAPSIEQAGFRRTIETDNAVSTAADQNRNVVYFNSAK